MCVYETRNSAHLLGVLEVLEQSVVVLSISHGSVISVESD
jgi:hypothetical protein